MCCQQCTVASNCISSAFNVNTMECRLFSQTNGQIITENDWLHGSHTQQPNSGEDNTVEPADTWSGMYVLSEYCWGCGGCVTQVILTPVNEQGKTLEYFANIEILTTTNANTRDGPYTLEVNGMKEEKKGILSADRSTGNNFIIEKE
eukprot:TRINITY_DN14352_c0_g1_i1.p1 TRINITY_DN14352_c0_g1~~TRINITY_DN14352_c0_g1_i1.p1  ORF type:complete len:147 (-),score=19.30 TRINITY_DN14352_c0_g1_i1:268-708(-)